MTFAELLARFDVVEEERDGYVVLCPSHDDSHPSLRIALQENGKVTVACRAGCSNPDVLKALEAEHGVAPRDLFDVEPGDVEIKRSKVTTSRPEPHDIAALRQYVAECAEALWVDDDPIAAEARAYVRDRFGLSDEAAHGFSLGLDHGDHRHSFEHRHGTYLAVPRLVVPFADPSFPERFHGAQGRALKSHRVRWCGITNPDGASWSGIGAFYQTGREYVLVTEGPSDALTVVAGGYDAIAVAGSSRSTSEREVDDLIEALRDRTVVIVGDADNAGRLFTGSLSQALADAGITTLVLDLPEGVGDVNEWRTSTPDTFIDDLHAHVRQAKQVKPTEDLPEPPESLDDDGPALTDYGNAQRLLKALGGTKGIRFAPEVGFFRWTGHVWEKDRHNIVRTMAGEVVVALRQEGKDMLHEAGRLPDCDRKDALEEAGKRLMAWSKASQSVRALKAMPEILETLPGVAIDIERMDQHDHLLTFANGTVNLRTGELRSPRPEDLLTRRIEYPYDPEARCPRWEQFLTEVFPEDPNLPGYVQRLIGYGITGSTAEQCFAVLWGHGANGKSVFTDTLTQIFRPVTQTTPFSTFEERTGGGIPNDIAALRGSRLVMAAEGESNKQMAEATIKRITGSDLISARFMRREFFEFRPTFLILLATNHKPQFRGQDEGLWRRVKLIPWLRYFAPAERDPDLNRNLVEHEAEGIIAWAVRGAIEWYAHGLRDPESVKRATEQYRETSDALSGYFPGRLERKKGETVLGAKAYHAYIEWAEEEGLPTREVWTRRTFYSALEERGVDRTKTREGQTLLDVHLVEQTFEPDVGLPPETKATPNKEPQDIDSLFPEEN